MPITTFYASTPITGIALGNADITRITPILSLINPPSNITSISIQRLSWTYVGGSIGNSNILWLDSTQNSDTKLGTNIIPVSINNNALSSCAISLKAPLTKFTLIRPSEITLFNTFRQDPERINGEFIVQPGHIFSIAVMGHIGNADKSILTLTWEESPNGPPPLPGTFVQNVQLLGIKNSINTTFTTSDKFAVTNTYKSAVFVNGVKQDIGIDYFIAEGGGPGTGYNTIIFIDAPFSTDDLTIDYYVAG